MRFLQYPSLDVGSVIKYMMTQSHTTGRQLAQMSGLPAQRISDYVNNRRRITVEVSMAFENAFNVDKPGYFYMIQANHDVYCALRENRKTPDLSKISAHVFWDSDISKMNWQSSRKRIIQRVFEYGDDQTISEIVRFYGEPMIKQVLSELNDKRLAARRQQNSTKL